MVSFWGAIAYAGVELPAPLTWGMVKGIVLRHLRWWQTQDDMWSPSGTLTIGYSYPNMYMAENYNSPGSPVSWNRVCGGSPFSWCWMSGLTQLPSVLGLPGLHLPGRAGRSPLLDLGGRVPRRRSTKGQAAQAPRSHHEVSSCLLLYPHTMHGMHTAKQVTASHSNLGGHCMLLSSGQACSYPMKGTHAKYGSFAYSSAYAYSVPPGLFSLEQYALASQLGLSDDGGEFWKARRVSDYAAIEDRASKPVLVSDWRPFPDVKIRTYLIPPEEATPNWHLRVHRIEAGREVMTADGSFAIRNERTPDGRYLDLYDAAKCEGTHPKLIGNYDVATPEAWAGGREGAFAVSVGAVGIRALEEDIKAGIGAGRKATLVNADPNSNLVESRTTIPTLQGTVRAGETVWYVSAIYAKPSGEGVPKETYLDGWEKVPEVPAWLKAEIGGS